jgi:hypothetical protein
LALLTQTLAYLIANKIERNKLVTLKLINAMPHCFSNFDVEHILDKNEDVDLSEETLNKFFKQENYNTSFISVLTYLLKNSKIQERFEALSQLNPNIIINKKVAALLIEIPVIKQICSLDLHY